MKIRRLHSWILFGTVVLLFVSRSLWLPFTAVPADEIVQDLIAASPDAFVGNHTANLAPPNPDWDRSSPNPDNTVQVFHKVRGIYPAGSKLKDPSALGGFGSSDNLPKSIANPKSKAAGTLYLFAAPDVRCDTDPRSRTMTITLVNATSNVVALSACDSAISIVQEAIHPETGQWTDLEYLPESFCGNSYHRVFLQPHQYWQFGALRYQGQYPTRLRFKFVTTAGNLYSNEFDGSVNLEQFTTIGLPYQRQELMDPNVR